MTDRTQPAAKSYRIATRIAVATLATLMLCACPQVPTQIPPPNNVNVAGAWSLTLTEPGAPALTIDMDLTQAGSTLSGSADSDQVVQYAVAGTISGNSVQLTLSVVGVPGADVRFDLNGTASETRLSGTYTLSGSPSTGSFVGTRSTTPPPPPPPTGVDISGDWVLVTTNDYNGVEGTYLVSLTQSSSAVSGTGTLELGAGGSYPAKVTGTVSGSEFSLAVEITLLPGSPALVNLMTGTASSTELRGSFAVLTEGGATGTVIGFRPGSAPPPPPPPPPPPSSNLVVEIENTTFTDMQVTIHDRAPVSVRPGGTATATFTTNPGSVRVQASTSGRTTSGTQVGLRMTWDFTFDTVGISKLSKDFVVGSDYFFLKMRNNGTQPLTELRVNYGLQSETYDNVIVDNSGATFGLGYYKAFTNSRVQARLGSTNSVVTWDNLNLPFTKNQTITLVNQY